MTWWQIIGWACTWVLVLIYWREARRERERALAWQESALRIAHRSAEFMAAADAMVAQRAQEPPPPAAPMRPPTYDEIVRGMRGRKVVCEPDGTRRGYFLVARGDRVEWIDAWVPLPYELTTLIAGQA